VDTVRNEVFREDVQKVYTPLNRPPGSDE
jgi:hypothetical protein